MQSSVISKLRQREASPSRMTPGHTTSLTLRFQYRDFHTVLAEGIHTLGPSLRSTEWVTPARSRESTVVPICGDPLASRLDYPAPWLLPRSSEGTDDASVRLTGGPFVSREWRIVPS